MTSPSHFGVAEGKEAASYRSLALQTLGQSHISIDHVYLIAGRNKMSFDDILVLVRPIRLRLGRFRVVYHYACAFACNFPIEFDGVEDAEGMMGQLDLLTWGRHVCRATTGQCANFTRCKG